jgi:hypothetical protein
MQVSIPADKKDLVGYVAEMLGVTVGGEEREGVAGKAPDA